MDILTFVSVIIASVAWPAVVLIIALVYRSHVVGVLNRIRKGRIGTAEFEFEQSIQDLKELAPVTEFPKVIEAAQSGISLAEIKEDPRLGILKMWSDLESMVRRLGERTGEGSRNRRSLYIIMRSLETKGMLTAEQVALLFELQKIRNQVAHDPNTSPNVEEAVEYLRVFMGLFDMFIRADDKR